MALIKDGKIYRTVEEQVGHLTDAHNSQLTINSNVSNRLAALEANAALGGYNYVRFGFVRSGTYYEIATTTITVDTEGNIGDYIEISSFNKNDIPAYGYYTAANTITIEFAGDFTSKYETLTVTNVTAGVDEYQNTISFEITPEYSSFGGTWLLQYDANEKKKQLFTVLTDLAYANATTKYASFDFNNDGVYNYVFIGLSQAGVDGKNIYTVTNGNILAMLAGLNIGDSIVWCENNQTSYVDASAVIGDVYTLVSGTYPDFTFDYKGNIRGAQGEQGIQGVQGEQGIQGVQGIQGIQGEKGEKGDTGEAGASGLIINTGIKSSAADLPTFDETEEGDAYVVLNSSGSTVTYDLYYHAKGGTDWDILSNWGGVKGDKGDKGDTGETGAQGIQGEQGEAGTAATISIGTVTTGEAGSSASVTNSGTENAAVLDFVIPKGDTGATGAAGSTTVTGTLYMHNIILNITVGNYIIISKFSILRNISTSITNKSQLFSALNKEGLLVDGYFTPTYCFVYNSKTGSSYNYEVLEISSSNVYWQPYSTISKYPNGSEENSYNFNSVTDIVQTITLTSTAS